MSLHGFYLFAFLPFYLYVMANLKSLAKDTAIYGLSSIVGRFLNYLLVPLYTAKLSAASGGYGVITNVYAYTALLLVILTYGMETTFFRFVNKEGEDPQSVFHGAPVSGVHLRRLRASGARLHRTRFRLHGVCRPQVVHLGDGSHCRD